MLEAATRALGHDHPDTLTAKSNLTITLHALGQLDQARAMEEQVLKARRRILGQDHSATIGAMTSLARTLQAQGHKREASSLLAEALAISLRVFGKKHTVTTGAAWQLARSFEPREAGRRKAFTMVHLSWLGSAPPGQLTAEQKEIKNGLKGVVHTRRPGSRNR